MKKFLLVLTALILAIVLCSALTGCANETADDKQNNNLSNQQNLAGCANETADDKQGDTLPNQPKSETAGASQLPNNTDSDSVDPSEQETCSYEEHDWQWVKQSSECWSATVFYTCSKCGMSQTVCGELVIPNHTWETETADGETRFLCTGCGKFYTLAGETGQFSYAHDLAEYKVGDPGVKHENFMISFGSKVESVIDVVVIAEMELTVEYDIISVFYDKESDVWRVDFWTSNVPGEGQSVYVSGTGMTCYIVYGE